MTWIRRPACPRACAGGSTRARHVPERTSGSIYSSDEGARAGAGHRQAAQRRDGDPYELYYLFPLTQEEESLSLVKGTLATAGLFVVVLLGAIAWLVVRQVVTPVRMAAGIAERLSAGRLQERMKVTGEDDIARLGEAFNKMAQNLQLKIQQLEELSRMQRRFVSDVSHELRTPLTTVRMAADVIHEAREDFDPVTARSAELLAGSAGPVRVAARRPAGDQPVRRGSGGAGGRADRPAGGRAPGHRRGRAARRAQGHPDPGASATSSRWSPRPTPGAWSGCCATSSSTPWSTARARDVVVRLAAAGGAVAVAVRDYGVGLKPGEATRVFNRFWRADPARARTTGGTGLGLSIAVEDARLHGGWLQAWGEPGGGSQFRLTLPRTADEPLRGSPIPLEPEDSRRARERAAADEADEHAATAGDRARRSPARTGRVCRSRRGPRRRRDAPVGGGGSRRPCRATVPGWWPAPPPSGRTTAER